MACFENSYLLSKNRQTDPNITVFPESDNTQNPSGSVVVTFQDLLLVLYHQGFSVSFGDNCTCPANANVVPSSTDPPVPADFYARRYYSMQLTMFRGDTRAFSFQCINQQDKTAIDLSGWVIRFTAKWEYSDSDLAAVISKSSPSNGIVITNPTNGQLTVTINPADTTGTRGDGNPVVPYDDPTDLFYDLEGTTPLGAVYTLASGKLTIRPDVSRA